MPRDAGIARFMRLPHIPLDQAKEVEIGITAIPVFAPGTGTPEIGGLNTHDTQKMLRGLRGPNLIGGDVVEVSPHFDPSGNTALVGATLMREIHCLLAGQVNLTNNANNSKP